MSEESEGRVAYCIAVVWQSECWGYCAWFGDNDERSSCSKAHYKADAMSAELEAVEQALKEERRTLEDDIQSVGYPITIVTTNLQVIKFLATFRRRWKDNGFITCKGNDVYHKKEIKSCWVQLDEVNSLYESKCFYKNEKPKTVLFQAVGAKSKGIQAAINWSTEQEQITETNSCQNLLIHHT